MKHKYMKAMVCSMLCVALFLVGGVANAQSMQFSPMSTANWTGTVNDTMRTEGSVVRALDDEDGYMMFDISAMQAVAGNIQIDSVFFTFKVSNNNYPWWALTALTSDPLTANPDSLALDIKAEESGGAGRYAYFQESGTLLDTVFRREIASAQFNSDFLANIPSGRMAFGVASTDNSTTYYIELDGWADSIPPRLEVYYQVITCNPAVPVAATALDTSSVSVSWNPGDSLATAWVIEYGPAGFTAGTGTQVNVTSSPYTVTGLMTNTAYDFYILEGCVSGGSSPYAGPLSATTHQPLPPACAALAAPFFDGFELGLDSCWIQDINDDFDWTIRSGSTISGGTGPSGANEGSNYLYTETSSPVGNGDIARIFMPLVDFTGFTNPNLGFDLHMLGGNMGHFAVLIWDGAAYDTAFALSGDQGASWMDNIYIDLTPYPSPAQVVFSVQTPDAGTVWQTDVAIDDIKVIDLPNCASVSGLMVNGVTGSTADLGWAQPDSGLNFLVEYGPAGFAPGTGTVVPVSDTVLTLTQLMGGTEYTYYVYQDCGAGVVSFASSGLNFTTLFTVPYFTDFPAYPPLGWTEKQGLIADSTAFGSSSSSWIRDSYREASPYDTCMRVNLWSTSQDEWAFMPMIDLGPYLSDFKMEFDIAVTDYNTPNQDTLDLDDTVRVVISTDHGVTWSRANSLATFTNNDLLDTSNHILLDLSAYSGIIQIGFYGESTVGGGKDVNVYVDNVHIYDANPNPCVGILAPVSDGFEAGLPSWITQDTADNFDWSVHTGGTTSSATGPTAANEGNFYIYTETSAPVSSGDVAILNMGPFDVLGLNNPGIKFDYHMYGASMGKLTLQAQDTNGAWVDLWSKDGDQGNMWFDDQQVPFGQYAGCNTMIRFKMDVDSNGNAYENDAAIDDIHIGEVASCIESSGLMATNFTDVSVDLSFTPGGGSSWIIEYGPAGFALGSGTQMIVASSTPTISGLMAGTFYDFYVIDSCGANGTSVAVGPTTVRTASCAAPCMYTINMFDSFGDGWNGASLEISVSGSIYTAAISDPNGSAATATFPTCQGDSISITYISGAYDSEVSFDVLDINGNVVVSVAQGAAAAGPVWSGIGDCTPCTPPTASFASTLVSGGATVVYDFTNASTSPDSTVVYAWDFGDGNTSTMMDPQNTFTSNGTYTVTLIASDNCGSDTATQVITITGIGILENLQNSFTLYPNPTNDLVNLEFSLDQHSELEIRIVNVQGAVVWNQQRAANPGIYSEQISLNQFPKGMYIVQLVTESGVVTKRVSLQ